MRAMPLLLDFRGQRQTVWMNGIRRLHYDIIYCWPYSVKCGLGFVARGIWSVYHLLRHETGPDVITCTTLQSQGTYMHDMLFCTNNTLMDRRQWVVVVAADRGNTRHTKRDIVTGQHKTQHQNTTQYNTGQDQLTKRQTTHCHSQPQWIKWHARQIIILPSVPKPGVQWHSDVLRRHQPTFFPGKRCILTQCSFEFYASPTASPSFFFRNAPRA